MENLLAELEELRKIDWAVINPQSEEEKRLCDRYIALAMINLYVNDPDKLILFLNTIWRRGHIAGSSQKPEDANPFQ